MGVPRNHPFLDGISHCKPSSYWGTPMARGSAKSIRKEHLGAASTAQGGAHRTESQGPGGARGWGYPGGSQGDGDLMKVV